MDKPAAKRNGAPKQRREVLDPERRISGAFSARPDLAGAKALLADPASPEKERIACLSALTAAAKKKADKEAIDAAFSDRTPLYAQLSASEPKLRKNAARLLGALGDGRDAAALAAALPAERTLFVVPSLLLALGRVGGSAAEAAIAAFPVPEPRDETEQKHVEEIRRALETAKNSFASEAFPPLRRLPAQRTILLLAPKGFLAELRQELESRGFSPDPVPCRTPDGAEGLTVRADDLRGLYRCRTAMEILLPVAEGIPASPEAVARAFSPAPALPYRLELRGYAGDRRAFLLETVRLLSGKNNPSHYASELRVVVSGNSAALYEKPCNVADTRYLYRKQAIPASIHPATAACLVRYARTHAGTTNPHPVVLDPCCGSGTLLFERERLSPCKHLFGVDLTPLAVRAARENAEAGDSRARFIQKDCLSFTPREPVDELYANLPFGNRVGTHEDNTALYAGLVHRLPDWLSASGFALLYTMEYRLLETCLKREPRLRIIDRTATEAGGLTPHVFLVRRA